MSRTFSNHPWRDERRTCQGENLFLKTLPRSDYQKHIDFCEGRGNGHRVREVGGIVKTHFLKLHPSQRDIEDAYFGYASCYTHVWVKMHSQNCVGCSAKMRKIQAVEEYR